MDPLPPLRAQDLFEELAAIRYLARLRHVRGRFVYEVHGTGIWEIQVAEGHLTVQTRETLTGSLELGEERACYLAADEDDFLQMVLGRRNVTTAVMRGCAAFRGDSELGLMGQHLFAALRTRLNAGPRAVRAPVAEAQELGADDDRTSP